MNSWDAAADLVLGRETGDWTNDLLTADGLTNGNEILAATLSLVKPLKHLTGSGSAG
jgi:hypothetical protein